MKPCYLAALVLTGWYLLLPPVPCGDPGQCEPNSNASISLWDQIKSYDSASKCEKERLKSQRDAEKVAAQQIDLVAARKAKRLSLGRCVASNDPRLKENSDTFSPKSGQSPEE